MNADTVQEHIQTLWLAIIGWLSSPLFYGQIGLVVLFAFIAYVLSGRLKRRLQKMAGGDAQSTSSKKYIAVVQRYLSQSADIVIPLLYVFLFGIAIVLSQAVFKQDVIVRLAQGFSLIALSRAVISRVVIHLVLKSFFRWSLPPLVILYIMDALVPTIHYLDGITFGMGSLQFSVYGIFSSVFFGMLLFWFGRFLNRVGKQSIRQRNDLDVGTQEVFAKLFEVVLIIIIFFILLNIMGINFTTLAVFGGAVGVGLGFGLQAIASNFISGIILLLDRSLLVGDYVELDDGRKGMIRQLNMRSATLETFDGKDIVVPNETFITSSFTNWTHKDQKQRYSLEFQVAYKTDLHALLPMLKETIASHPKVISGEGAAEEKWPDAEISGFGEYGVNILLEYWMEGIDDGKNRVGADLMLMIWDALKEHVVEIPLPQHDIRIIEKH